MSPILNIAGYRFVALSGLPDLRDRLHGRARELGIRGTVLLAGEGLNVFVAGSPDGVRGWLETVRSDRRLSALEVKESWSDSVPFRRLKVKIKREIIRMDHPTIRPDRARAESVEPRTLKRWLDVGHDDDDRPLVLLDTRNAFEVEHGTFAGAVDWRIAKFTEFPGRLREHQGEFRDKRIVSFCTGGIRCEKAAILMRESGLEHVVQLDGGILKYFEEVGQHHFNGSCFVFDERVSLTAERVPDGR